MQGNLAAPAFKKETDFRSPPIQEYPNPNNKSPQIFGNQIQETNTLANSLVISAQALNQLFHPIPTTLPQIEILPNGKFYVEIMDSNEITTELVSELAKFYRFTFNNENGHFLMYPSTGEFVSPKDVFKEDYVSVDLMDQLPRSNYPIHPQTSEQAIMFHDPKVTFEILSEFLKDNAYLIVLRDSTTHEISGMTFEYKAPLSKIFENEWKDPFMYSTFKDPKTHRSFKEFLQQIQKTFLAQGIKKKITADTQMYCWNCTTTAPHARGLENFLSIVTKLHREVIKKEDPKNTYVILETKIGKTAHKSLKTAGAFDVPGIFDDDTVIMCGELAEVFKNYSLSPNNFKRLCIQRMRKERQRNKE